MVQGSSPNNPLVVIEGTDRIALFAGQSYVVSSRQTRLGIGTLEVCATSALTKGRNMSASLSSETTCTTHSVGLA